MTWLPDVDPRYETELWVRSGAHELTGYADGPPQRGPGAPASVVAAALADIRMLYPRAELPDVDLLSERARLAGCKRNAPSSCGGAFRILPTPDGWFGLSLARESDLESVPALTGSVPTEGRVWETVADWLARTPLAAAKERIQLLGLAGSTVRRQPNRHRRDPIIVTPGGPRETATRPLVIDLTALWAGPLCGHLLALTGARVLKVESRGRPDGARSGPTDFFERLNGDKEPLTLDFTRTDEVARLRRLVRRADVVLEASRPRALQQLGIDASAESQRGRIWLSITAYGRAGTDGMRVGFGDDVAAGAGLVAWDERGPYPVGDAIADPLTGVVTARAVTHALAGSRGALLDVSMHDVAAWTASLPAE